MVNGIRSLVLVVLVAVAAAVAAVGTDGGGVGVLAPDAGQQELGREERLQRRNARAHDADVDLNHGPDVDLENKEDILSEWGDQKKKKKKKTQLDTGLGGAKDSRDYPP